MVGLNGDKHSGFKFYELLILVLEQRPKVLF